MGVTTPTSVLPHKGGRRLVGPISVALMDASTDYPSDSKHLRSYARSMNALSAHQMLPGGEAYADAIKALGDLYAAIRDQPQVTVAYREWQSWAARARPDREADEGLFLRQTYVAAVARLVALRCIEPVATLPDRDTFAEVFNGDHFRQHDIRNFGGLDFFSWVLSPDVLEGAMNVAQRLLGRLSELDIAATGQGLLEDLYWRVAQGSAIAESQRPPVSEARTDRILTGELKLGERPDSTMLDPACGPGTNLSAAVRVVRAAFARRGYDEFDILLRLQEGVAGMDPDPAASVVSGACYLLALGDLVRGPHPPFLVPIYRADALSPPSVVDEMVGGEAVYVIGTSDPDVGFELPESLVDDPIHLDWVLYRLPQYLGGAQVRATREGEKAATEAVMVSLYSYLTSPKRSGLWMLPPLSTNAADTVCRTAGTLVRLALNGEDTVWMDLLANTTASIAFARRKFDLVVSNVTASQGTSVNAGRVESVAARYADLYLRESGTVALVVPRSMANRLHAGKSANDDALSEARVIDLNSESNKCLVLFSRKS